MIEQSSSQEMVERAARFVEHQELGFGKHGAAEVGPLQHAAPQFSGAAIGDTRQVDLLQQRLGAAVERAVRLHPEARLELQRQVDVLPDG